MSVIPVLSTNTRADYTPYLPSDACQIVYEHLPFEDHLALAYVSPRFREEGRDCPIRHQLSPSDYPSIEALITDLKIANLTGIKVGSLDLTKLQSTESQLIQIIKLCPTLQTLKLYGHQNQVTNEVLKTLKTYATDLHNLELRVCNKITAAQFIAFIHHCTKLHTLRLDQCHWFNDEVLQAIQDHCKELEAFGLVNMGNFTPKKLITFIAHYPKMRDLRLHYCAGITDAVFREIGKNCKDLQTLNLGNCNRITLPGFISFLHQTNQIHTLGLQACCWVTDDVLRVIAERYPDLQELGLWSSNAISSEGVAFLVKSCKKLHTLNLSFNKQLDIDQLFASPEDWQNLRKLHLNLNYYDETEQALINLGNQAPNLSIFFDNDLPPLIFKEGQWILKKTQA